jgi:hypothetical protein
MSQSVIEMSSASIELCEQFLRGDAAVRILGHLRDFVPIGRDVEPQPDPTTMAYVGRYEEPLGLLVDQLGLHAGRSDAPDRQAPVTVVIVVEHDEGLLAVDEEGRRAVARPLGDGRKREARRAHLGQRLRHLLAGAHERLRIGD